MRLERLVRIPSRFTRKKIQNLKSKSNSKILRIISEFSQKGYKKHQIIPVINGNVINLSNNLNSERKKSHDPKLFLSFSTKGDGSCRCKNKSGWVVYENMAPPVT